MSSRRENPKCFSSRRYALPSFPQEIVLSSASSKLSNKMFLKIACLIFSFFTCMTTLAQKTLAIPSPSTATKTSETSCDENRSMRMLSAPLEQDDTWNRSSSETDRAVSKVCLRCKLAAPFIGVPHVVSSLKSIYPDHLGLVQYDILLGKVRENRMKIHWRTSPASWTWTGNVQSFHRKFSDNCESSQLA